jgi:hypothetical protein
LRPLWKFKQLYQLGWLSLFLLCCELLYHA